MSKSFCPARKQQKMDSSSAFDQLFLSMSNRYHESKMHEDLFVKRDESDPKALEMREAIVKDAQRSKENSIPPIGIPGIGRTSLRSFHTEMPEERIPSTVYGLRGSGLQEEYARNESVPAGLHWEEYDVRR